MTGVCFENISDYRDIAMKNKYNELVRRGEDPVQVLKDLQPLSRDNSRTPVQWDDSKNAGFTSGISWIKVNPNYKEINVKRELETPDSVFHYYKKLIALRKENEVMVYGDYADHSDGQEELYIYTRSLGEVTWLIVLNQSERTNEVKLPEIAHGTGKELLLGNYAEIPVGDSAEKLVMHPYEARIYRILNKR
ncbi:alpha-glucosidase C-terminal domain-containing protein [Cytobacillus firmus]|nr:alpha-glucosidase C-terminal domain-containing protein [Cytobacillus firmus]MDD9310107.1 alpha-glucosidase C-terminal domain-containing protein [Cytobacillus firmus]